MINKNADISLPILWGEQHFKKNEWGFINYIVGPNGSGKSLLAAQIKSHFSNSGFTARYLNAERLLGFEKAGVSYFGGANLQQGFNIGEFANYKLSAESGGLSSSGIIILKERLDIRLKIEAILSDLFGKKIRLVEEGGYLKPKMQNIKAGGEYNFSDSECHGLKELITLLTFLYDPAKNCIIFDEPELHLHPQFQAFFLEEIRKVAGNPIEDASKKVFFIITHSPYFIDLKNIDDLKNVLVCQLNKIPSHISDLDGDDEYILKKFLPRFNTHHKQFFFSSNPVFVEGYTDQQIISIIFEKLGINIGASGSCLIDVGGKDELSVFYKLCKALKINCRIIADLDAIFRGRLRRVVCEDERSQLYVQEQGIGANLSNEIGDLETQLNSIINSILDQNSTLPSIANLKVKLSSLSSEEDSTKKVFMLLAILNHEADIRIVLGTPSISKLNFIIGRLAKILIAFKSCNVFIFPKGEIENYYTQSTVDYLNITSKDVLFHKERDYLLEIQSKTELEDTYSSLISIVKEAVPVVEVDIKKHLKFEILDWIHVVQTGIARDEIKDEDDLIRNTKVNYLLYNQILEIESLTINANKTFRCIINITKAVSEVPLKVSFSQATIAHGFEL